ncbi:MAG: DUF1329 domain-containing protein [Gammaproteobacteria bacterium]
MVNSKLSAALFASAALVTGNLNAAVTEADVQGSFFPYQDAAPAVEGITPGTVINQSNWQIAADHLDEAMLEAVKEGWTEIKVDETTSFDLHPAYVEATSSGAAKVSLGEGVGNIMGYTAGRPFPQEPSIDDPRAGEKLAWNYQYGYNWGDNANINPFYWKFRNMNSGKVERTLKFGFSFLNFKHRVGTEPIPEYDENPADIFRSIYLHVLEPFDLKNTQLLIYRYKDDAKRDDSWLYLGFQRRVRRLATGQVTDSFLGSDLMIQDFEGYNGRISDMNWRYLGTQDMLLPFYNHNDMQLSDEYEDDDGYRYIDFGGKGGCFPQITWQLRKAYKVEVVPVDESSPISKRIVYMDAQTFTLPRSLIYDKADKLWKTFLIGQAHPDHHLPGNKGTGVSLDDSFMVMDMQSLHCTTGQFRGMAYEVADRETFSVQHIRIKGR